MAVEDTNSKASVDVEPQTTESADDVSFPGAPELDGSIDALVANLRAAREQFAEFLERAEPDEEGSTSKVA
ncbi:MAG: hypothetical protein RIC14_15870 [Filomicrobium sp.]